MKNNLDNMEQETGFLMDLLVESILLERGFEPTENKDFINMAKRRFVHHYFNDSQFKKKCKGKYGRDFLRSFVSMWLTSWKANKLNRDRMIKAFS